MRSILVNLYAAALLLWLFAVALFDVVVLGGDSREADGYGDDLD
jgi:hypothetical protein